MSKHYPGDDSRDQQMEAIAQHASQHEKRKIGVLLQEGSKPDVVEHNRKLFLVNELSCKFQGSGPRSDRNDIPIVH